MDPTVIIGTSVLLQIIAAVFALIQMREIELRRTWLAIAAALVLMSVPRAITLMRMITGQITRPPDLESELVALDISFLMGIGIAYATRLFRSLKRAQLDLMRSQQTVLDSEMRLRTLIDDAPDAILTTDKDGIVFNANHATEDLMGIGCDKIIGRSLLDLPLFKSFDASPPQILQTRSIPTGTLSFEASFPVEPDRIISAEVRGFETSIHGESYQIWIARDVTEKKRLRTETDHLQEQLRHAERLQTVGTLAGGIAHDFNNILTPIVGYTELAIRESGEAGVSREHLENVIRGAMRARDLVKQILAFSRQGSKQTIPLQLQPLLKETLTLLRASIPTTIEIATDIDPTCGVVLADPGQIHQVIMNLCTNAFYAMRESGGTLSIALSQCDRDDIPLNGRDSLRAGPFARLVIHDTGHGMDQATLSRIFEPFFTTKSGGQGSGLGLAVAHGIVSAHGGAIIAASEPGKGTTFTVFLPLDLCPLQQQIVTDEQPVTGTERVLIVDDEPDVAVLLSNMLSVFGFRVTHRTSSIEALGAFRASPYDYDVIVTDQTMPHLTGIELASKIRDIRADIPIILMTGFSEKISPDNYRALGLSGYLMKPVLASSLTRLIHSLTHTDDLSAIE